MDKKWQFWIDRGGTFTDIIGVTPQGKMISEKRPSADDGGLSAIRDMIGIPSKALLPASQISQIRIGTTIATNALLERRGEPTAVVITKGFADTLLIGDQTRPHLFSLQNERSPPLWCDVIEINERIDARGKTITAIDEKAARRQMKKIANAGIDALAISLMHGFMYSRHEKHLLAIAQQVGIKRVIASHEAAEFIKLIPRTYTAVVDVYLALVIKQFIQSFQVQCEKGISLLFMQSDGTLVAPNRFRAVNAILSGPAGGVVGAYQSSVKVGVSKQIIGFDMGGTSTDVSLSGSELRLENRVAGVPFFAPIVDVHTVAAGGGSIVRRRDGRLLVGPMSAGANPGPACYRQGGPLTITDCNIALGRLQGDFFPAIFGKKRNLPPDIKTVNRQFLRMVSGSESIESLAEQLIQVAVENMAAAVRRISVARGVNPADCIINSFGGAAGQHVCRIAQALAANQALVSRQAPLLSAWGIGMADVGLRRRRQIECSLSSSKIKNTFTLLIKAIKAAMPNNKQLQIQSRILCRYQGIESLVSIDWQSSVVAMRRQFENHYLNLYGYYDRQRDIIVSVVEVEAVIPSALADTALDLTPTATKPLTRQVYFNGRYWQTPFYPWSQLTLKTKINGPAIIWDKWNTVVVEPGWQANVRHQALMLRRIGSSHRPQVSSKSTPAMLEIFNNRFMAVAEQMGETLRRVAVSVNIRERLDFSCAVFDNNGNLVANAPHIPVHLGSMGDSVRYLIKSQPPALGKGDTFVLNSPYHGGTHLPDITVIKPGWFNRRQGPPDYYLAARGHHADVGGISAGSMPAASRHIDEEGVLMDIFSIVSSGKFNQSAILKRLCSAPYPARNTAQNIADLQAQIASLESGINAMRRTVDDFGVAATRAYMQHIQHNATRACRRLLQRLSDGNASVYFDDGAKIKVAIRIKNKNAIFDFSGTSNTHFYNFNAPQSVVYAAVIYCLRVLLGEDMTLNDGIMKPIKLIIPSNSMLSPSFPAAVAAGNVEVSQNIVDAVFTALGICAQSQGTCNNLTIGIDNKQYYETICGGSGASAGIGGASAMQVHMTNSLASDPEVLENNYPLRLNKFAFRYGSGGKGKYAGGMGAVREILFLKKGEATILSSRRKIRPQGINGGGDGKCGRNIVLRKNGEREILSGCTHIKMNAGDMLMIETPGGGGWGVAD